MRTAVLLALCAGVHAAAGQEISIAAQSNAVQITWPAPAPGFVLQHTVSLESTVWTDSAAPALVNGFNVVSIPTTNASGFFRLARSVAGCSTNSADEPDMEFRDTDCDGIDGTATNAIFVSTTGADLVNDGLHYRQPVRTIGHALTHAAAQGRNSVYIQAGTYVENVDLPSGINLYGGFDANWNRGLYTNVSHRTVVQGGYHTAEQWITLRLTGGSTARNDLQNLVVIGSDATSPGYSSMVIHALNASVDLDTVGVYCGDGADGTNGTAGLDDRLARANEVPLPTFLILDSPMKNISERENRKQFEGFNQMLYELAETELRGTQFVVIDKEYDPPHANVSFSLKERYMTLEDPDHPPLIKSYTGK